MFLTLLHSNIFVFLSAKNINDVSCSIVFFFGKNICNIMHIILSLSHTRFNVMYNFKKRFGIYKCSDLCYKWISIFSVSAITQWLNRNLMCEICENYQISKLSCFFLSSYNSSNTSKLSAFVLNVQKFCPCNYFIY